MGEPMNNYDEVASAVQIMIDPQAFALRRSAVTISTVGVIPRMLQMMTDLPGVSLALSLHAPTQDLRKTIVPSAKAYPLDKLMAAVDKYQMQTRQKVTAAAQCCQETGSSMYYMIGLLDCYTSLYSLCLICCVLHNFSDHSISFLRQAKSKLSNSDGRRLALGKCAQPLMLPLLWLLNLLLLQQLLLLLLLLWFLFLLLLCLPISQSILHLAVTGVC